MLARFQLNADTGGEGLYRGGDGVIREILFRRPLTLSVLTERRVFTPYGLQGSQESNFPTHLLPLRRMLYSTIKAQLAKVKDIKSRGI